MSLNDLISSYTGQSNKRLTYNSTVKDEVDNIQINIDNFRRVLDAQKKQQGEIQFSIKKLEEESKTHIQDIHKEISERINYLTEAFKSDCKTQNKEFQYLELQNSVLCNEHQRLEELANLVSSRAVDVENNVG